MFCTGQIHAKISLCKSLPQNKVNNFTKFTRNTNSMLTDNNYSNYCYYYQPQLQMQVNADPSFEPIFKA